MAIEIPKHNLAVEGRRKHGTKRSRDSQYGDGSSMTKETSLRLEVDGFASGLKSPHRDRAV